MPTSSHTTTQPHSQLWYAHLHHRPHCIEYFDCIIDHTAALRHTAQSSRHPFGLRSSFGSDFAFTNYTYRFKGTIDYIWFSRESLMCESILGPLREVRQGLFLGSLDRASFSLLGWLRLAC
jgi:hypothetical protein